MEKPNMLPIEVKLPEGNVKTIDGNSSSVEIYAVIMMKYAPPYLSNPTAHKELDTLLKVLIDKSYAEAKNMEANNP